MEITEEMIESFSDRISRINFSCDTRDKAQGRLKAICIEEISRILREGPLLMPESV